MNTESLKAKLLAYSKAHGRIHQNTLTKFFQERFLYRLSQSDYRRSFLLKGGALAYSMSGEQSRHTKDIDFLWNELHANQDSLVGIFREISRIAVSDGVVFDGDSIIVGEIQKEGRYEGTRIRLNARLGKISQQIQIDIGIGDHVTPGPQEIKYPTILDDLPSPILYAYSLESLVAEKFNAMIDLGEFNSRYKDFYDIHIFIDRCDEEVLKEAVQNTFTRRRTKSTKEHPLFQEAFFTDTGRVKQWSIFVKKNRLQKIDFRDVHQTLLKYLYPIYIGLK